MATDFTQDAVLVFLQRCGGSAKNTELLAHFLPFLRDKPDNVGNRDRFKSFVNSVATVSKIDGVSTVTLRKKYRGHVPGAGSGRDSAEPGPVGASLSPAVSVAPPGDTERNPALPAAGIVVEESGTRLKYRGNPSPEPQVPKSPELRRGQKISFQNPVPESPKGQQSPPQDPEPSAVPLDALEHHWMVKAAAGAWPDVYALFRADSSLLNRQDFISGFTVLHWIAKHGDHRVINTLRYGMEQKGLSFDVNAKSTARQTPLHIAAIHGHKNIIRLLVKKFGADVKLRDAAGKKAWQYLSDRAPDILELLAAPPKAALTSGAENDDPGWKPPKQQQRRLRHHFSSASSGQRPQALTVAAKVSRSTSIAALLKPKSLQRF
uniref:SOWAHA-C winged helix-turn-helix domain-containing protein n=1 Tax=Poecilia reticulata TaxID=8081 RepID=A0A3P9Q5P9_POERE